MQYLFEVKPGELTGKQVFDSIHGSADVSFQVYADGIWLDGKLEVMDYWSDLNYVLSMSFEGKRIGNVHVLNVETGSGIAVSKNSQSIALHLQIKLTVG